MPRATTSTTPAAFRPDFSSRAALFDTLSSSYRIHQSYPKPLYFSKTDAGTLYGIELEVATKYTTKQIVCANESFVFLCGKSDGSITRQSPGMINLVEMVTRPATKRVHKAAWLEFFKNLPSSGFDQSQELGNGLHIHVERDAFSTPGHLKNFIWFISAPQMEFFSGIVSGRRDWNTNSYSRRPNFGRRSLYNAYKECTTVNSGERYLAVNLQNSKTVEVRMFYSTPNYAGVMKALEFVDSVLEFTREVSLINVHDRNMLRRYNEWLNRQPETRYEVLKKYYERINIQQHIHQVDFLLPSKDNKPKVLTVDAFNDAMLSPLPEHAIASINHQKGSRFLVNDGDKVRAVKTPTVVVQTSLLDMEAAAMASYTPRVRAA